MSNHKRLLLAIDDVSLPMRLRTCLYLSKPTIRPQAVLAPSDHPNAPDNKATHFYGTVLHENGKFRMWYYACHLGKNPDWSPEMMQQCAKKPPYMKMESPIYQGPLCYAESADGITWNKPALGQVLFKGTRANNALALPHTIVSGATVVRDESDPDASRRYKMVYQFFPDQTEPVIPANGTMPSIALAVSADGIAWTPVGIPFPNQFIEPCAFVKHAGQFIVHYQVMGEWAGARAEGGTACGRVGVARISPDFRHWPDMWCETFALPEPLDRTKRGPSFSYDQVHLGVGAASLGNVCVGLYGLWHNAHFDNSFHDISCDLGLLVSNDGLHFREPAKGHIFISQHESPALPVPGKNYKTNLCQGNGIVNVGDETFIYHGRWRNVGFVTAESLVEYRAEVALATLPRDRWGALGLNPDATTGTICSAPITLSADASIALNADGMSGIGVELLDENFVPITGFSGGTAGKCDHDGIERPVRWAGAGLGSLAGRTVRVQVRLTKSDGVVPRVYAIYL